MLMPIVDTDEGEFIRIIIRVGEGEDFTEAVHLLRGELLEIAER
jgi:hypothetical protein